ncbi:hypothetical protein EW146_g4850 [Bondarzewia mesenterica]|uniref:Pentatricopeptide repeat-containing protein-mitochondrial domain-containing protein n=1 Tax=Bondarzewia mesenterica TaxID=1095465 RepID=A0A4S4LU99_9AGAM|nr:hypothetical protein EW146_g4850 [Bondarzewia mesenterica]
MLASSSRNALSVARKRIPAASQSALKSSSSILESVISHRQQRHASTQQHNMSRREDGATPPPKGLRSQPWTFDQDASHPPQLSAYNLKLGRASDTRQSIYALRTVVDMKQNNIEPDIFTYNLLLETFAKMGAYEECWAIMDDMRGMEIQPTIQSYNYLIQSMQHCDHELVWDAFKQLQEVGLEPNSVTYMWMIRRYTVVKNLEMALLLLVEMEGRGLSPRIETAEDIILLATRSGTSRLAIDLAQNYEASSVRRLGTNVWVKCLLTATRYFYKDGVVLLWPKVVHTLNVTPDEGLCLEVLHTAGRHGLPDLAMDVLRTLKVIGAELKEYHFAPIIEAFCRTDHVKDALALLAVMRENRLDPTSETSHPIFLAVKTDSDAIDSAWDALEELHKEEKAIDITAINVIVQASVALGDLQRAFGTYQIFPELGVKPDADTYNFLLSGCIAARHRELGDRIVADMKDSGIKPDALTYERLIILCLTGQTYEDAFFYLEEMKAESFQPPIAVYEAIVRRCVSAGDPRYRLALDEMKEFNYEVSPRLDAFIENGGTVDLTGTAQIAISLKRTNEQPPRNRLKRTETDLSTVSEVPGPNSYNVIQASQLDDYKKGAFLEKASRFTKDKPSDVPGPGTYNPDVKPSNPTKGIVNVVKANANDRYAALQRKLEDLEKIHADGKRAYQTDLDRLKGELLRSQKSTADQAERLEKSKKQNDALEARLLEMKKATASEQAEIKDLRVKLRLTENERTQLSSKQGEASDAKKALQVLESKRRDDVRERDRRIAELEKAVASEKRKREVAETRVQELKGTVHGEVEEARANARQQEMRAMEAHVAAAEATASLKSALQEAEDREEELLSRLSDMQTLLSRVAEDYGRLASSSAPKAKYEALEYEHAGLQLRAFRLERKLGNSEGQVVELASLIRQTKDDNAMLQARLRDVGEHLEFYSSARKDALDVPESLDDSDNLVNEVLAAQSGIRRSKEALLDLYSTNIHLSYEACRFNTHTALRSFAASVEDLEQARQKAQQDASELESMKAFRDAFASDLAIIRTERDNIRGQLVDAMTSLEVSKANEGVLTKQLQALDSKIQENKAAHEQALKKERETTQRLATSVQKHKMAEEALRAEIEQLTTELTDAERYQEAYQNLVEEVEALAARNELAEDEAQRLSRFNAEILGHNNPAQRIMYLDRIRRELAETKQTLVMVSRDRDAINAHKDDLQHELDMYKSVAVPLESKTRTAMTRVERIPLAAQSTNVKSMERSWGDDTLKTNFGVPADDVDGEMTLDEIM